MEKLISSRDDTTMKSIHNTSNVFSFAKCNRIFTHTHNHYSHHPATYTVTLGYICIIARIILVATCTLKTNKSKVVTYV